jgi:predicted GTPase
MTIAYHGKSGFTGNVREAYITYEEKEQEFANKVFAILVDKGYEVIEEEECASIPVYNSEEYKDLVKIYKEAKKAVRR